MKNAFRRRLSIASKDLYGVTLSTTRLYTENDDSNTYSCDLQLVEAIGHLTRACDILKGIEEGL